MKFRSLFAALWIGLLSLFGLAIAYAAPGPGQPNQTIGQSTPAARTASAVVDIRRISVASDGTQANGDSYSPRISADGRYIVFQSDASNLVPGDTNGVRDVFVHDMQTGITSRVSVASNGAQADKRSNASDISGDGRYVVFASDAGNLVPDDIDGREDVFVHDRLSGVTEPITPGTSGEVDATAGGPLPSISADGRFIAYRLPLPNESSESRSTFLLFVYDRLTKTASQIGGIYGVGLGKVSFSGDGRYFTFGVGGVEEQGSIVLHDSVAGQIRSFSFQDRVRGPTISEDGRLIAFETCVERSESSDCSIAIYDHQTGQISKKINDGRAPKISADGRYIVFSGTYVYDGQTGRIGRASVAFDGAPGTGVSGSGVMSADNRYVAFQSTAPNLVPGDTNGVQDIFVVDFSNSTQDTTKPDSSFIPLPAYSHSQIALSWRGADRPNPFGYVGEIDHYDVQVRVGENAAWVDVITGTLATKHTYTASIEDFHSFRVRAVDNAGNVEDWPASYDTRTFVDLTSPTGSVAINHNPASTLEAVYTTGANVFLRLWADDNASGVTHFRVGTDGNNWGPWQPILIVGTLVIPIQEIRATLPDDGDGLKHMYVQYRDGVGHLSQVYTDTILLDGSQGTNPSISINNGALFVNSTAVTLTLPAPEYTADMQVSNDGGFGNAQWQPYSLYSDWQITGVGAQVIPRTVYVRFRNTAGTLSQIVQDEIVLDTTAPTSRITQLAIAGELSADTPVVVGWSGSDEVSGVKWYDVQVRVDGGDWQPWLTEMAANTAIYYARPGHTYAFRTRAQDNAGNWEVFSETQIQSIMVGGEVNLYLPSLTQ